MFATLLSLAMIAAGVWRVGAIVGTTPMLGYANQFDMRRTSACVGLWPDLPPAAQLQAHPEAPLSKYVAGPRRSDECYWSSELLFVAPAALIASTAGAVSLRFVGIFKAFVLFAVAFTLNVLLRVRPAWMLLHAAVFALVICDPMNVLWFNSLYTEFAALLGAYLATVLLVLIASPASDDGGASSGLTAAFVLSLLLLGLSRQQHALLPLVLALPAVIATWPRQRRTAWAISATVVLIAVVQLAVISRHPTIAEANNADTVLGAILPASTNQALTARRLGLPERCLASIGATWYQPMGEQLQETCPEVLAMSRAAIATLIFTEPVTIARTVVRALPQFQDWRLGYLGTVEGKTFAGAEAVRAVAGTGAASIAPVVTATPPSMFSLALCVSLALLVCATPIMVLALLRRRATAFAVTIYALASTVWYAILTSVMGDGYVEVARHAQLASVAMYALLVVISSGCASAAVLLVGGHGSSVERSASRANLTWVGAALVAAFLSRGYLQSTMNRMPMSIGVVDRPQTNVVTADGVEFSGWAIDPRSAATIELVTDDGTAFSAQVGDAYTGARGESLGLYYPAYPGVAHAGFSVHLPSSSVNASGTSVRTFVINADGIRTEIDRRRLVRKAG